MIRRTTTRQNKHFAEGLISPFGQPLPSDSQGVDSVTRIILAASDAEFSPREFRLGSVSDLVLASSSLSRRFLSFTKNLEILEWQFAYPLEKSADAFDDEEQENIILRFRAGFFYRFIQHATLLRELIVELPLNASYVYEQPFSLVTLLGDIKFDHLAKFHISDMWAESDELYEFLIRHAETLEDVYLTDWKLSSGTWIALFKAISGKLKNLKQFELGGRFEDESVLLHLSGVRGTRYGKEISRYVRGEIKDYPLGSNKGGDAQVHEPKTPESESISVDTPI